MHRKFTETQVMIQKEDGSTKEYVFEEGSETIHGKLDFNQYNSIFSKDIGECD